MQTLKDFLTDRNKSEFALSLGISRSLLSQYISGHRRPGYERAREIEDATGGAVPASVWLHADKSVNAPRKHQDVSDKKGAA